MTAVTFDRVTKRYARRRTPVLADLSLAVQSGELLALLGPSGSGKSTLLKLVAGLEAPDAGDIRFDEQSVLAVAPNRRQAVLMFQKPYLFPFLNVGENIAFGLKVKRLSAAERRTEVARMLDLIGLSGFERRRPAELSGGEQQRVALARAIVTRPKLLLLDEPFSSLDTPVRLTLQEAVRSLLRKLGITTILVTHDLDEAMAMSDRMALLMHGRVAACDRPQVLFQRPACVETARFVGVTTFIEGEAGGGWLESPLGRLRIGDTARSGRAVYAIRPEHIGVRCEPGENSLPGVVRSWVYRGEHVELQLALGGTVLRAHVPAADQIASPGEAVQVVLPADHLFELRS